VIPPQLGLLPAKNIGSFHARFLTMQEVTKQDRNGRTPQENPT